ncbi:MAG: hypothetical protein ABI889_08120 [Gemmatimonadota bacterium]
MARSRALCALVAAALFAAGCSSDGSTPTRPENGALVVTVSGLPSGAAAALSITGPNGYSAAVTHTSTLSNLAPGSYELTAGSVAANDDNYAPSPASETVAVGSGTEPVPAAVVYSKVTTTLDLSIAAMYLTQSTQTLAGAVPLVQNRDGYLRVFVVANQANSVAPQVRVRFYVNGAQQGSAMLVAAPSSSVPTSVDQGALAKSWNLAVPGSMIKPGLSMLADIDPSHTIPESQRANNSFPVSGNPQSLVVKSLSPLYIRFVPVKQSVNSLTGDVSSSNKDALLAKVLKIHPISSYSADVHATFTTNAVALTPNNSNGAWESILSEMQALRVGEGSPRNYFGIVKTSYTGGIAGISYIGGAASLGYDGSSKVEIISHELGHSWGRLHAPCGINGTTDPSFPYASGNIGAYGLDVATATLYPPVTAEVMSYCHPQWISDYTYTGIYNWRSSHPSAPDFVHADFQPCIIVWGRVVDGRVVLEPSFQALTHPSLPERGGAYALRALDKSGATLFALSFDGDSVADAPAAGRSFAYAIPLSRATKPVASLVLAGPRGSARRDAAAFSSSVAGERPLGDASPALAHRVGGNASITWNALRYPLAVVRDAKTGEILAFARGGAASVETAASDLELTLSDGVQSTVLQRHVAP